MALAAEPEVAEEEAEAEAGEEEAVEDHLPPYYLLHHSPLIPTTSSFYNELDCLKRPVGRLRSANALTV